MFNAKVVSSLEKVLLRDDIKKFQAVKTINCVKGERVSFQIVLRGDKGREPVYNASLSVRSKLTKNLELAVVKHVPVEFPTYPDRYDEHYIAYEPSILPDALIPLKRTEKFTVYGYNCTTVWATVDVPTDFEEGEYPVCFTFTDLTDGSKKKVRVTLNVANVTIKDNDLKFTQWFHCDCIATYFGVKMMSEKHWRLIENYIKTAARTGVTMILTPHITPALDTEIGKERPTMQLVKIEKNGDKYSFDFKNLERWIDLCHKYGIKYFEMAHLFSQWGLTSAPKIVVNVNGKDEKMFGWHTPAQSREYQDFLSQYLPKLSEKLKALGIAENTYFHISDEPSNKREHDFENYLACKNFVKPLIKDFKIIDALSNIEFYDKGLIDYPVPANNHIEPFMERDIKERWVYYCCSQCDENVSNRFIAMPSYRTRVMGIQMYNADMKGFLQWGYNFYYSQVSKSAIDPYQTNDGLNSYPAGDSFSVYPYKDGAIESIRTKVFYEAIQDRSLLQMVEKKIGRKKTIAEIEKIAGGKIDFKHYPMTAEFVTAVHDKAIELLK